MTKKSKSGDVGAGGGPVLMEAGCRILVTLEHGGQGSGYPPPLCRQAHVGREESAGAESFRQQDAVAGSHAALLKNFFWIDQAVDGEAQGELAAFAAVASHQGSSGLGEDLQRALQHLFQEVLNLFLGSVGDRGYGQGGLRRGSHREDISKAVVRGDLAEDVGVVDDGPEGVNCLHQHLAPWRPGDRGVIGSVEPDEYIFSLNGSEPADDPGEYRSSHLGSTPAAAHGHGGELLERFA